MKRLLIISIAMFFISNVKGQAHLGATEYEIRQYHPDTKFSVGYTSDNGDKYIYAQIGYGTFFYYFNKTTKLSDLNIMIPNNQTAINAQVELYNKKYVIVSDTSWKAYLEGGGILIIKLLYDEKDKFSYFTYESASK